MHLVMLGGCKLDPTVINALVERWRLGTQTFHLSCGKCTITLEDLPLQPGLLVDRSVVMGSTVILDKEDLCEAFLESHRRDGSYHFYISE
ncbi:hypothetical protein PVK06_017610 [Gossypium arboreum]|uniref:Aminotransferase-like plant mobile domain-containing protein n=1 Tax=Gossypium arboreum TaxID=29729 RepID=A0ABR0Q3G2_GOSAR|nr:hypothetical protein PVK06_017610 [Gossypium arboreum]